MGYVKFWADLAANLPDSKDPDTLYFITDTGQLYKGSDLIADKTPGTLSNPNSLQLLDQEGAVIGTYDGSATVPLKAGAFVQISKVGNDYVINSANTTYDLQGALNQNKTAYEIALEDNNSETTEDKITIPVMVGSGSNAAAGLVPRPDNETAGTTKYLREDGTWTEPPKTTLEDLGLGNAIHFLGKSSTAITNGGSQKPTIGDKAIDPKAGDVVFYESQEFIFNSEGKWELFGDENSYVLKTRALKAGAGIIINDNLTESTLENDITIKNTGVTNISSSSTKGAIDVFLGGVTEPEQIDITGFEDLMNALTWQSGSTT